jgi:hypothetical protein
LKVGFTNSLEQINFGQCWSLENFCSIKAQKLKYPEKIIILLVLYGRGIWSPKLKIKRRLRVFEKECRGRYFDKERVGENFLKKNLHNFSYFSNMTQSDDERRGKDCQVIRRT